MTITLLFTWGHTGKEAIRDFPVEGDISLSYQKVGWLQRWQATITLPGQSALTEAQQEWIRRNRTARLIGKEEGQS